MTAPEPGLDLQPLTALGLNLRRLPTLLPIWQGAVNRDAWSAAAHAVLESGGRLVSMWGVDRRATGDGMLACAAFAVLEGLLWIELPLDDATPSFPDLSGT